MKLIGRMRRPHARIWRDEGTVLLSTIVDHRSLDVRLWSGRNRSSDQPHHNPRSRQEEMRADPNRCRLLVVPPRLAGECRQCRYRRRLFWGPMPDKEFRPESAEEPSICPARRGFQRRRDGRCGFGRYKSRQGYSGIRRGIEAPPVRASRLTRVATGFREAPGALIPSCPYRAAKRGAED